LVPVRVRLALQRDPAHLLQRVAGGQELARGAADVPLVLGQVEVHPRGRPSTRSATMFLRISVVPPSIELARARRKRYVQTGSTSCARGPRRSCANSVSAWLTSAHSHLPSEPSGPGSPSCRADVSPR